MRVIYNFIELKILKTNTIDRQHVYSDDGLTYLYTRWWIDVWAVVNRAATSYKLDAMPVLNENDPVTTDVAIRAALRAPRKGLLLQTERGTGQGAGANREAATALANKTLLSFDPNKQCDVKGGPYPRLFNVDRVNGVSTMIVRWAVETFTTECSGTGEQTLLSHRWQSQEDVGEDHFPRRTIRGQAVFNLQKMFGNVVFDAAQEEQTLTPLYTDQFRRQLFHPIPPNWARKKITVTPTSDNSCLNYVIVDAWQPIRWGKIPVTKVTARHTSNCTVPSFAEETLNFSFGELLPYVVSEGLSVASVMKLIPKAVKFVGRTLPQFTETIDVSVWSDGGCTRKNIIYMALGIMLGQMQFFFDRLGGFRPSFDHYMSRDLTGKSVNVHTTIHIGPWNQVLGALKNGKKFGIPWGLTDVDATETVIKPASGGNPPKVLLTPGGGGNAAVPVYPPAANATRGTVGIGVNLTGLLISLVTQALESPGTTVVAPTNQTVFQHPDQVLT